MIICGIDPGQKGGIGFINDPKIMSVHAMPILDKKIDVGALITLLDITKPHLVIIEQQSIRPAQAGAMSIGANYGRILGCVEYLGLPHRIVTPGQWNKRAGVRAGLAGRPKKEASYAIAKRTWGKEFDRHRIPVTRDGLYESLLIARYG